MAGRTSGRNRSFELTIRSSDRRGRWPPWHDMERVGENENLQDSGLKPTLHLLMAAVGSPRRLGPRGRICLSPLKTSQAQPKKDAASARLTGSVRLPLSKSMNKSQWLATKHSRLG